ncbi:hypothetical protein XELAEV_18001748mg [Xenopus laevis]|uniref:Uncharacterized protein n=1 Tax=Xenopus laevis TaxID=8355 RepID=A0A974GYF7_XENLA|nr:hypothetical protein XELAEV_18001748mg [Xenopus laevis]
MHHSLLALYPPKFPGPPVLHLVLSRTPSLLNHLLCLQLAPPPLSSLSSSGSLSHPPPPPHVSLPPSLSLSLSIRAPCLLPLFSPPQFCPCPPPYFLFFCLSWIPVSGGCGCDE